MAQFLRRDVNWLAVDDPIVRYYGDAVAAMRAKPASDPTSWSYQAAIHGTQAANPPVLADGVAAPRSLKIDTRETGH